MTLFRWQFLFPNDTNLVSHGYGNSLVVINGIIHCKYMTNGLSKYTYTYIYIYMYTIYIYYYYFYIYIWYIYIYILIISVYIYIYIYTYYTCYDTLPWGTGTSGPNCSTLMGWRGCRWGCCWRRGSRGHLWCSEGGFTCCLGPFRCHGDMDKHIYYVYVYICICIYMCIYIYIIV